MRVFLFSVIKFGTAMDAKIATIASVITNSSKVKPFIYDLLLLLGLFNLATKE
jgi:hypothetical protein